MNLTFRCLENITNDSTHHEGLFLLEPLEAGQGITLGNALRRTLLSELSGYALSGVRINKLKHEFGSIYGVREDALEVLLNLKQIIFKEHISINSPSSLKGFLHVKGPQIVTASSFYLPQSYLSLLNPNLYICTILNNSELYIEMDIKKGKGYKLAENYQKEEKKNLVFYQPFTLMVDSLYMPIKKVNFKVKLIYDSKGALKESLLLEIITNGSISPKRALYEGCKNLVDIFSSLFLNSPFQEFNSHF
jgi:DNA-directed RNA polymerase subunit alpha